MSDGQRLVDLETRAAFQEHGQEQLSEAVLSLRAEVEGLREEVAHLRQRLKALTPSPVGEGADETPPPHY